MNKLNKILRIAIFLHVITSFTLAQTDVKNAYIELKDSNKTRIIHFFNEHIARITMAVDGNKIDNNSELVKLKPKKTLIHYEEHSPVILAVSNFIIIYIKRENGAVKYEYCKG